MAKDVGQFQLEYERRTLIPEAWLAHPPPEGFYTLNPAIVRFRGQVLMVYRVDHGVNQTPSQRVTCAICRLDEQFQVIPGSIGPLSDTITEGGRDHYDPRFLVYRDRLFIHYNNNYNTNPNQIYLVELDPDTLAAKSPARGVSLTEPRREIEKNWLFFEHEGDLLAVYTIAPHVILRAELSGTGPIVCRPVCNTAWDVSAYAARWGEPRGGTPPMRWGEVYLSFFHSRSPINPPGPPNTMQKMSRSIKLPGWLIDFKRYLQRHLKLLKYYGGVYGFAAAPPFKPIFINPQPVLWPEKQAKRRLPAARHLHPRLVVYPCGALPVNERDWLVSFGVHDERCALRVLPYNDFMDDSLPF
jgi:hypothetical protein